MIAPSSSRVSVIDVLPGQKPRYVECGVIQLSPTDSLQERLKQLASELSQFDRVMRAITRVIQTA